MVMVQTSSLNTVVICCCMLVGLLSCQSQTSHPVPSDSAHPPARETPHQNDVVSDLFRDKPQVVSAWRRFNSKGNYRIAQFADFQFSDQAIGRMSGYDSLWRQELDAPYIFGDITRLGRSVDVAMIIIDDMAEDPRHKFGLVAFNAEANGTLSDARWVSRDPNLSTTTLGWSGNWPSVFRYAPDGSLERLFINWHQSSQTYTIDKDQIGSGARNDD